MKRNNLDEFFKKKLTVTSFQAQEEDWENVLIAIGNEAHVSISRLYWLLLLLPLLIVGTFYFLPGKALSRAESGSFGIDRTIHLISTKTDSVHSNKNVIIPKQITQEFKSSLSDRSISESSHSIVQSELAKPNEIPVKDSHQSNVYLASKKSASPSPLATKKVMMPAPYDLEIENPLLASSESKVMSVESIQPLPYSLLEKDDYGITTVPARQIIRKKTLFELETTLGLNATTRQYNLDLYYSLLQIGRLRGFIGVGIFYRQTDSRLLTNIEYPSYGFGSELRQASMYGVGKTMVNIPFRVSYHINRNSSIQGGIIMSKHLAGRGWTELSSDQNQSEARHWIVDKYYDNWILSGQLHYKYEWQWGGIGGGLRLERLGPQELELTDSFMDNFLLMFECKITKKF